MLNVGKRTNLNFINNSKKNILFVDRDIDIDHPGIVDSINSACHDMIVFDDATHYKRGFDVNNFFCRLKKLNLSRPWIILTSDFTYYHSSEDQIVYYPYHCFVNLDICRTTEVDIRSLRNNYLGFLPWHLYPVRLSFLLKFFQQDWFNKCLVNYLPEKILTATQKKILESSIQQLSPQELGVLKQFHVDFPNGLVADMNDDRREIQYINNSANTDCYINFMIESEYDFPFITEKSIKPYLCGQFSAVLSNNLLYNHLEEIGIDILKDYLDMYVPNIDVQERVDITIKKLSKLILNIEQIWIDTYQRRLENYNYVRSTAFVDKLEFKIKQWVN